MDSIGLSWMLFFFVTTAILTIPGILGIVCLFEARHDKSKLILAVLFLGIFAAICIFPATRFLLLMGPKAMLGIS